MSHVVPDIVQKIVKGQDPLHILGAGNQIRHYTYAGDLARGIRLCIENPNALNEDFNISTPDSTTVLKLAKAIWEKINPNKPFSYVSDTPYKYDAGFSVEQAKAVFLIEWTDERAKIANMLAMVTGIRAGEIQGLRIMGTGQTCVYIRHSWNHRDGLKSTKNNEERTVEVPFPNIIADLLRIANKNPHGASQETFVFWADKSAEKPMEQKIFIRELREDLVKTDMSSNTANIYMFHSWRHYYTSYMMDKVNDKLLRGQTGHKTLAMLEDYSDHTVSGDQE